MTKQTIIIIIQSLLAACVIMWLVLAYTFVEAVGISEIFTNFSWNSGQSSMGQSDFTVPFWYYLITLVIALIFGLFARNLVVNVGCAFWALCGPAGLLETLPFISRISLRLGRAGCTWLI